MSHYIFYSVLIDAMLFSRSYKMLPSVVGSMIRIQLQFVTDSFKCFLVTAIGQLYIFTIAILVNIVE